MLMIKSCNTNQRNIVGVTIMNPVHMPIPAFIIVGHELLRSNAIAGIYCSFDKLTNTLRFLM